MRIILNSDIIYTQRPVTTALPVHIVNFCRNAGSAGGILVLPRTTLLEYEYRQTQLANSKIAEIENAIAIINQAGITTPAVDVPGLVLQGDLLSLLRATGISVEIEDPTLEDYRSAERRACLHLSPRPPETDSDEMRDLVIWEVALRIATRDGKAMLISRDHVHSHDRGANEANAIGLLRAKSVDDALDLMGTESPAGVLAKSVVGVVWSDLRAAGLPLPTEVSIRRVSDLQFVTDIAGHASGSLSFAFDAVPNGQLTGKVSIAQIEEHRIHAELSSLQLNNQQWESGEISLDSSGELPKVASPAAGRLSKLHNILGGE